MILAGMMKRLIGQIPIKMLGQQKVTVGKCKDFGTAVGNLSVLVKKRTSLRDIYGTTLSVDMSPAQSRAQNLIDSLMNLVLDYDSFCEIEEKQVDERKEKE